MKKLKKMISQTNSEKTKKVLFLEKTLKLLAVLVLKKYNPRIIGITGSVGKTSTKEAVHAVLSAHYRVRKNEKNFNNEIGLPLTIIGSEGGGNSTWRWLGVFLKALSVILFPVEYPEILVLEMGADRPGDIKYLTAFLKCEVAIITDVSGSHLEYFKTIEKVGEEKWSLVESLPGGGSAVVNIDNSYIAKLKDQTKREDLNFLTFGFSAEADIQAMDVFYNYGEENQLAGKEIRGLSFKLNYKGTTLPVRLNNILARHNIYAALAAVAAGINFKLNLVEIAKALENFCLPQGRMSLVSSIKNAFIIDDTYNSSPVSALAALEVLRDIQATRKIVVMGDMLELGKESETGHRAVAKKFLETHSNIFMAVGKRMQWAVEELKKHNISPERLFVFADPMSAGRKLQEIIQEGDLILIKGSQGMRMEKVVEEIMEEPQKAEKYLCRQSADWKERPWKEV